MPTRIYILNCLPFGDASLFRKGYRRIDEFRQKRIDRYAKEEDKRLGLGAGLLVRYLRKLEGIESEIHYNEHGKAFFEGSNIHFNISHSGNYAVLAVSDREVGVDIESHHPHNEAVEATIFTENERELLKGLAPLKRDEAFFRYWTEKESYLKYLGVGLAEPLNSVDFSPFFGKERFTYNAEEEFLHFHHFNVKRGYSLCVCSPLNETPEVVEVPLKEVVDTSFIVNGNRYELEGFLGKGKGGYSFLIERDGQYSVLKCLHHEPNGASHEEEADKFRNEQASYATLMGAGIRMPAFYEKDEKKERIRKEYIPGSTIYDERKEGKDISKAKEALKEWLPGLYEAGLNIDYFPTNFIYRDGELYYLDYECHEYDPAKDFEHWGEEQWR